MKTDCAGTECYEISPRFRAMIEQRIAKLEEDAEQDETQLERLEHPEHIQRHLRLVNVERAEALRMRLFLDRSRQRLASAY